MTAAAVGWPLRKLISSLTECALSQENALIEELIYRTFFLVGKCIGLFFLV